MNRQKNHNRNLIIEKLRSIGNNLLNKPYEFIHFTSNKEADILLNDLESFPHAFANKTGVGFPLIIRLTAGLFEVVLPRQAVSICFFTGNDFVLCYYIAFLWSYTGRNELERSCFSKIVEPIWI